MGFQSRKQSQIVHHGHQGPAQLHCHIWSMLCHSMEGHSAKTGCFVHTEFSREALPVGSGCGPWWNCQSDLGPYKLWV